MLMKSHKNSINAGSKSGYKFVRWELRDGSTVIATYTNSALDAKNVTLTKDGLSLVAVFEEGEQSGGQGSGVGSSVAAELENWKKDLLNKPLTINKVAQQKDYENRIYQIDLRTSSRRRAVDTDVVLNFIVDTSRSMYFPATITSEGNYNISNLESWLSDKSHSNEYFVIADKDNTATMYAVYYVKNTQVYDYRDNATNYTKNYTGWVYTDASFYHADDGKTNTVYAVADITSDGYVGDIFDKNHNVYYSNGKRSGKLLSGEIYSAPERVTGELWTRLDYLLMAVDQAVQVVYELDPQAKIGLTTFNKAAEYQGQFPSSASGIDAFLRTKIIPDGGTNQTLGLNTAKDSGLYPGNDSSKYYAVLVTDGAPVTSGSSSTNWTEISKAAGELKDKTNKSGTKLILYTLGVSLKNVGNNATELNKISTKDIANLKTDYQADTGEQIAEAVEKIVESMLTEATLFGTAADTVDPAFYPVTKDGGLIAPGYYDKNGGSLGTTQPDTSEPYYQWINNGGTWTITWYNQRYAPEADNGTPGWQKTIYVKAKEDFLGGNTIRTNAGGENDKVTATGFVKSGGTISSFDTPVSSSFETPYVNVDELSLDKHDTEWTVYLGTEVDPLAQLKELFRNINVREVVSKSDTDWRRSSNGSMLGGTSQQSATFPLKDAIGDLTTDQWATLTTSGTLTIPYTKYDDSRYGSDHVGSITLTLTKTETGSDYGEHHTTAAGTPAEIYTLKAEYTPGSVDTTPNYHTTSGGSAGDPTGTMESTNTHKINVYAKKLTINKVDQAHQPITSSPATFKLYRKSVDGDDKSSYAKDAPSSLPAGNCVLVETLTTSGGTITSQDLNDSYKYYLVETQAPAGYNILTGYFKVVVDTNSTYTKTLDQTKTSATAWNPWELSEWVETSTVKVEAVGEGMNGFVEYGEGPGKACPVDTQAGPVVYKIRNDAGYELPSTGGPGTRLFTILGSVLICFGGVMLVRKRRRWS